MDQEIKIMLVEDKPEDAAFTQRVLKLNRLHRDLVLATCGREAMESLKRGHKEGNLPDLILLDINLPDISGIDLLTRIKRRCPSAKSPWSFSPGPTEDQDIQKS